MPSGTSPQYPLEELVALPRLESERGRKGRTALGGNQGGTAKWGDKEASGISLLLGAAKLLCAPEQIRPTSA